MANRPEVPASLLRPQPRGKLCEKMCEKCPFRPDGSGYAQEHPDMPRIIRAVELGLPFYCHETVIFDERTTMNAAGDEPEPQYQEHFELCRGGHERRMQVWEVRAREYLLRNKVMEHEASGRRGKVSEVVEKDDGTWVRIRGALVPWWECREV